MSGEISRYAKIFHDWEFQELLGKGSNGAVYKITKNIGGLYDQAAVKIITLCQYDGKKEELSEEYRLAIEEEIKEHSEKAIKEARLMQKLRNNTNIVNLYDCDVKEWSEGNRFGADLLLRIELLHNLAKEQREGKVFSEQDIIRVGKDICNALILCHSREIVHRDIKPENIFRDDYDCYKLGDFGVSRILEMAQDSNATRRCGTAPYMAPEQYTKDCYDFRVDIYSLGLVLYELANHNRLPFAKGPRVLDAEMLERLKGNKFPAPSQVSVALGEVIMKACAHSPEERYQSAEEFWDALNALTMQGSSKKKLATSAVAETNMECEAYEDSMKGNMGSESAENHKEADIYATRPAGVQETESKERYATSPADAEKQSTEGSDVVGEKSTAKQEQVAESMRQLIERAEQGDMMSQFNLAWCYDNGDGVPKSPEECARWFRRAAEQGYGPAQFFAGRCYMEGYGVAYDAREGAEWFAKAAGQGDLNAINHLGVCYDKGNGVEQNCSEAILWFQKAAEQGHAQAQYNLGAYYANGYGIPVNKDIAFEWYRKSAEQGYPDAQNMLGICYHDGLGTQVNEKEAIKWYRRAAAQEFDWAYLNLGDCYETGFGVELDMQEAKEYYQKAAALGNEDAAERLKRIP